MTVTVDAEKLVSGNYLCGSTISGSFSSLATSSMNTSILSVVIVCQVRDYENY